jgi:predicted transcriptional regulator of viral defense system
MKLDVIETMRRLGKSWFTIAEMQKITALSRPSLRVFLSRWTRSGRLERIGPGLYRLPGTAVNLEQLGTASCFPSYVSFESALSKHGILSQLPYVLTFATTHRSRRLRVLNTELQYRHLRPDLFFGYEQQPGVYIALPEKALLDQLYMVTLGRASLDPATLNLAPLRLARLRRHARAFPATVKRRLKVLMG